MTPRRKVAVILQLWQNFDRGILQGIASYVREGHDWSVFVEEVEHQRIPDFKAWDGDGLIVNFDNPHVVRALRGVDKPIVAVGGGGGWHDPASGVPYVATDDVTIGRLAAEHLMDCSLRNFAFCGYPKNRTNVWMMNRKQGFTERLAKAGFSCHCFHGRHTTATHWQDVLSELSAWLRKLPLPVGIMGCYDYRARHVLEACKALGLRVPDDVALIGVDNDIICELADPPLSSIEQGRSRIGYSAAATLELDDVRQAQGAQATGRRASRPRAPPIDRHPVCRRSSAGHRPAHGPGTGVPGTPRRYYCRTHRPLAQHPRQALQGAYRPDHRSRNPQSPARLCQRPAVPDRLAAARGRPQGRLRQRTIPQLGVFQDCRLPPVPISNRPPRIATQSADLRIGPTASPQLLSDFESSLEYFTMAYRRHSRLSKQCVSGRFPEATLRETFNFHPSYMNARFPLRPMKTTLLLACVFASALLSSADRTDASVTAAGVVPIDANSTRGPSSKLPEPWTSP